MKQLSTPEELEFTLGDDIKSLRLQKNIDRHTLCLRAGVSETALRNLEGGKGATLKTLIRIIKALQREDWLHQIAPVISINPLHIVKAHQRQRARRKSHGKNKEIKNA